MSRRPHISMEKKCAAALLALGHVPYEDAKLMTAAQLISLFEFDHGVLYAIKRIDDFWNLTPRLIADHRLKSREDTAIVAKVKRLARANEEAQRRLLAKHAGEPPPRAKPKRKIQSAPFPKQHRPMRRRAARS